MTTEEGVLTIKLADYVAAHHGAQWIEERGSSKLFDYVFGANGVFVRAARPGLDACVPVAECEIRGLALVEPFVSFSLPRVPLDMVAAMFNLSRSACVREGKPVEALFHLIWLEDEERWRLDMPEQIASGASVRPADDGPGSSYERALIELHSHHQMDAFFSGQDDADEQGFRLYAVIGEIFTKPTLRVRVGIYGYFYEVDASEIFELPEGVNEG